MGCVGSKKEHEAPGKGMGSDDLHNRAQAAHYVKDPTTGNSGSKSVSNNAVTVTNERKKKVSVGIRQMEQQHLNTLLQTICIRKPWVSCKILPMCFTV